MKFIGKCPCCNRDMFEIDVYKDFRILQKPYFTKAYQISAEKQNLDPLSEVILNAEYSDYQTLADDTAHRNGPTAQKILTIIKENIDKFYIDREEIVQYAISEAIATGMIDSNALQV